MENWEIIVIFVHIKGTYLRNKLKDIKMKNAKATATATKPTTSENYTAGQFHKLPKWCQNELLRLENNVAYHKKRANMVANDDELSNTRFYTYSSGDGQKWKNLPNNESISFFPKENSEDRFDVKVDGLGRIEIYSNTSHPKKMVVIPLSSNVVALEII